MATNTPNYNLSVPEDTDTTQDAVQAYRDNLVIIDNNLGGGGGSANIRELTQAEYDALPDTKLTDDTMYLIKDANSASDAEFTHVYGTFIDTSDIITSGTYTSNLSYTAVRDCFIRVAIAEAASSSSKAYIDGNQVFGTWNGTNGIYTESPIFPLKKGQTLTVEASNASSSAYVVYGTTAGSEVTFLSEYASACYSTQEREVGCWIDGKPLYQRTWDFSASPIITPYAQWVDTGISASVNIDKIIFAESRYGTAVNSGIEFGVGAAGFVVGAEKYDPINNTRGIDQLTLLYTKTTDTAGSGQWTPMAQPTHHYSTTEQVVGTWIDGKPIYEITLMNLTLSTLSGTVFQHGIANFKECIKIFGRCKYNNTGEMLPLPYPSTNSIYVIYLGNVTATTFDVGCGSGFSSIQDLMVTIQYTKTTD